MTSNPLKSSEWCTDDDTVFPGEIGLKISNQLLISGKISNFQKGLGINSEWRKKEEGRIQWRFASKKKSCKHIFKEDLALLTIAISSPKAQKIVRRSRVTFPDLIGNLGKSTALSIFPRKSI